MLEEDIDILHDTHLKRGLFKIAVFFIATPLLLSIIFLGLFSFEREPVDPHLKILDQSTQNSNVLGASLEAFSSISGKALIEDARPKILKKYLANYYSPLEPHADQIISIADKYQVDYKLITAIARKESNLCKSIPEGSFNCWGWGVYSKNVIKFNSFEEAIEAFANGIKTQYIEKGLTSLTDMGSKYNPVSPEAWANSVEIYMNQLEKSPVG